MDKQLRQRIETHKLESRRRRGRERVCPNAGEYLVLVVDADSDDTEVVEVYRVLDAFDSREIGRRYAKERPPGIVDDCELDDEDFVRWLEEQGFLDPISKTTRVWVANLGTYASLSLGAFDPREEDEG